MSDHYKDNLNVPQERLTTTNEDGSRIYVHPAHVTGRYKRLRVVAHALLILVFLILPWIRIGGHQALLLDVAHRKFAIFGLTFWAHDAPMLVFIFGGAALSIVFMTALLGRVWCGWACPQTVFIEAFFRRIETWIEGDHIARKKLDQEPWNSDKFFKRAAKWSIFTAVALVITHSLLAYFIGTDELAHMIRRPPSESPSSFLLMTVTSGIILFDFGWFREQFCTIACPYGRFQSVLMDEHSLVVAYDIARGEPRKGSADATTAGKVGDCVSCNRCVAVCPTGIDIRRGTQLECVACTACADACDDVMVRVHKPTGLIRYTSEIELKGKKQKPIRPRTVIYALILAGIASALIWNVKTRTPVSAAYIRAADTPFSQTNDEHGVPIILNRFKVDITNQTFDDLSIALETTVPGSKVATAQNPYLLRAGQKAAIDIFVEFPKISLSQGKVMTKLNVVNTANRAVLFSDEVSLVGPYQ